MVSPPGGLWKYQAWRLSCLEQGTEERGRWAQGLNTPFWSPDQPAWQAECLFHLSEPCWAESAESKRDVNTWSMINTTQESVHFSANRDIFNFCYREATFHFKAPTPRVSWEQDPVRHYMPDCCTTFLKATAVTAMSQLVFPAAEVFPCHSQALQSHLECLRSLRSWSPTWCADPLTARSLSGEGALCPSPLWQLSQAYWTLHLIVLDSLRGGNAIEPIEIWVPQGLN